MAGTLASIRIALKSEICTQIRNRITNYETSKVLLSTKSAAEKCSTITKDNKVPKNVEEFQASQKAKFSPSRNRETNSARILSKLQQPASAFGGKFMSDQKSHESKGGKSSHLADVHVGAYDCNNTVSLSSVVSGNVPTPFKMSGNNDPAKYNMQGGKACQGDKYIAGDLRDHHNSKSSSKGSKVE